MPLIPLFAYFADWFTVPETWRIKIFSGKGGGEGKNGLTIKRFRLLAKRLKSRSDAKRAGE